MTTKKSGHGSRTGVSCPVNGTLKVEPEDTAKASASTTNKYSISDTELQELKTAFVILDLNKDNRISVFELQHMLKNFGINIPGQVVAMLMRQASASGEKFLKENEFLEWISSFLSETPEDINQDLKAAFKVFDKDNEGYITREKLKLGMEMIGEKVTEEEINSMIELADLDHDGRIDLEEFTKLLL